MKLNEIAYKIIYNRDRIKREEEIMGKYKDLAKTILQYVGGEENIESLTHCVTRLRFQLIDESKANDEALKNLDGVVTVIKSSGQYQVVIGNHVKDVYNDVCEVGHLSMGTSHESQREKSLKDKCFDFITGIFMPQIAVMTAAGMFKGVLALASYFSWIDPASGLYTLLSAIADAMFLMMPVVVGYTSAVKMKMDGFLGLVIGCALVYPTIQGFDLDILGMTINVTYTSTVLPIILTNALAALMYKYLNKIVPDVIKTFVVPMLILMVAVPLGFVIIGPVANQISTVVLNGIMSAYQISPVLAGILIGGFWQVLVVLGVHSVIAVTAIITLASGQPTPIFALNFCTSFAQLAVVFAIWLKTKDQKLKNLALPAWISAIFGVTEPAIYGVTLPRMKQFVISCIGGALGSAYLGLQNIVYYQLAGMGIFAIPGFIQEQGDTGSVLLHVGISLVISMVFSFVASYMTYKDRDVPVKSEISTDIYAPIEGDVIPLSQMQDEAFSSEALGKGICILPSSNQVVAPVTGTIMNLFPTLHAIGLISDDGVEVLIHIGMDTVQLNGEGFKAFVKQGDYVQKGDLLIEFDIDEMKKKNINLQTPVVITNTNEYTDIQITDNTHTLSNQVILTIRK